MATKKKKPQSTHTADPKAQARAYAARFAIIFNAHGVVIMFLIAGIVVGYSLLRARSYLNPERDEIRYQEGASKNTFGSVDYKLVQRLQDSLKNANIDVSKSINPSRSNPFNE